MLKKRKENHQKLFMLFSCSAPHLLTINILNKYPNGKKNNNYMLFLSSIDGKEFNDFVGP